MAKKIKKTKKRKYTKRQPATTQLTIEEVFESGRQAGYQEAVSETMNAGDTDTGATVSNAVANYRTSSIQAVAQVVTVLGRMLERV